MARALAAAIAASLLAVSGAGGAGTQQTPKRGGTVVIAMNSLAEPPCLGWAPECLGRWQWRGKVLASAFRVGPHRRTNDLVAGYSLGRNPFTVTLRIRPQASWSDGKPITARDFVFAYQTYLRYSDLPAGDPTRTEIRRMDAVDAKTVRFVFRSRFGNWRFILDLPPLPEHALRGEDLAASEDLWRDGIVDPNTGKLIGSGPFLVGPWERGKQLVIVRNPRYWGRHVAYVDRIVLRFVRGPDTEQALRSGDFDLGVLGSPRRDVGSYPGFDLVPALSAGVEHLDIRVGPGGHPALKDKRVRRALAYGIDRVALVRALLGGDSFLLDSAMYLTGDRSYRPNWSAYRYQPVLARRLLEQAGCRRGADGIYSCAGERMRLRFVTTSGAARREQTLQLMQAQLRRVGIEVEPVYVANLVLFDSLLPSGAFDVALFASTQGAPEDVFNPYPCPAEVNINGFCSRLIEADGDQLDRIVDPRRRAAVANRVDRRLAAAVPGLPLFQGPQTYVVRNGLRGVVPNAYSVLTAGWSVWNAENWWLER